MSSAHLKANLTQIEQTSNTLNILAAQFGDLTSVTAEGDAAGNAPLASALNDFANGWSDKRNQFISQMRSLATDASNAVKAYESTDNKLATAIKPSGTSAKPRS